jgi:hypothetical protein
VIFNIVTPSSRPENLDVISASLRELQTLNPQFQLRWYVVFDPAKWLFVPPSRPVDSGVPFHFAAMGHQPENIAGGALRNIALNHIREGWVYFLDDDNLIKPELLEWLAGKDSTDTVGYVFDQVEKSGDPRLIADRNGVRNSNIDTGQFILQREAIGSTRFLEDRYDSDFFLFDEIFKRCGDRIEFVNLPLTTYNVLR